jgi:hypothetical protein
MNLDDLSPELRRMIKDKLEEGQVDSKTAASMNVQESSDSTKIKIGMGKFSLEVPRPSGPAWDSAVLVAVGGLIAIASAFAQAQINKDK